MTYAIATFEEIHAELGAMLDNMSPEVRAKWDAIAAEEAALQAEYAAASTQQHVSVTAHYADADSQLLARETIAPESISRATCRAVALEAGADGLTIRDTTYTRTRHNAHGEHPERCVHDRLIRYNARTDTLQILERGKLIYVNQSGHILRGEDTERLHAECEFGA